MTFAPFRHFLDSSKKSIFFLPPFLGFSLFCMDPPSPLVYLLAKEFSLTFLEVYTDL